MKRRPRLWYRLTLVAYFGIMILLPIWYGWWAPPRVLPAALVITILALPLFAALRGMLHGRPYTVSWSLFLSLFYLAHGIAEFWANAAARAPAGIEILLAGMWLVCGIAYVRTARNPASQTEH